MCNNRTIFRAKLRLGWRLLALAVLPICLLCYSTVFGADTYLESAGPIGLGYVGMYYGLVNPANGQWYEGEGLFGTPSTTWHAVVDTGASANIIGGSTQAAYDDPGIPLEQYPNVKFTDEGFGGFEDFAVTEPVRLMIAGQAEANDDPENHSLYTAYGPIDSGDPPSITMAASLGLLGEEAIDFDILGMSLMEGRVLHVDPQHLELLRLTLVTMAGALVESLPAPSDPNLLYVPLVMQDFFSEPQTVDVGGHPMLPISVRKDASDPFATRTALFDSGSPVNFVSASFAQDSGIDLSEPEDLTITVQGIGPGQDQRPGYYVDALALELGAGRQGDRLMIGNTAVFIIPDDKMPGDLEAILGNSVLSPSALLVDTIVDDWYVDFDPLAPQLVLLLALPGDVSGDGYVGGIDLTVILSNWGQSDATRQDGDLDGNGVVDGLDYAEVLSYWGQGTAPPAPAGTVPEPATLVLLGGGILLLMSIGSRRGSHWLGSIRG